MPRPRYLEAVTPFDPQKSLDRLWPIC